MTRAEQAELEWAIRNRASLTKEQRAKYRKMWDAANPSAPKREKTRSPEEEIRYRNRATQPSDLDPLDAAAAPIETEAVAGPVRKRSRADAAVDRSMSGSMYSPSEIVDSMDVTDMPTRAELDNAIAPQADGLPPGYAAWSAAMAEASGDKPRAERLKDADAFDARVARMTAGYNASTGMPQPSGLAGDDGYRDWSRWQPGDPVPDRPRMGPTALESARESQAAERNAAIGQKYGPIAQRIAEAGDAEGVTDYAAVQAPRERYKNEARRQLENRRRFDGDSVAQEDLAKDERRQTESNKKFRDQVANAPRAQARRATEQERLERWQAISMLAGGNPTRQQFAMGNAFLNMPSDWQNAVSAKALRPDMDGTTPLTVEANSAKNAMRLLNADMIGQGGMGDMRLQMMEEQRRQKAREFAVQEAEKLTGGVFWDTPLTPEDARRLRRRVEALYPGMGGVVDSLDIAGSAPAPTPPNPTGGAI